MKFGFKLSLDEDAFTPKTDDVSNICPPGYHTKLNKNRGNENVVILSFERIALNR